MEPVVEEKAVEEKANTKVVEESKKKVKKPRKKKVVDPDAPKKTRKPNGWIIHVKEYREKHPEVPYKQVLQDAKATYKKPVKA